MNINTLLQQASAQHASDIHFTTGQPPWVRVDGQLHALEHAILSADDMR